MGSHLHYASVAMSTRQGIRTSGWAAPRSHSRVRARTETQAHTATLILTLVIAASIGALCFLAVRQTTVIRDLTAQCAGARELLVGIEEVNRTLEFDLEQAFSLARISEMARSRLGMVEPTRVRYVPIDAHELP